MQLRITTVFFIHACLFFCTACSTQQPASDHFFADYEQTQGWYDIPLETGIAHSGSFSHKVARNNEFSHGFSLPVATLKKKPFQSVTVSAWVNCIDMNEPVLLTVDVMVPATNEHLQTGYFDIQPEIARQTGVWKKVSMRMQLQDSLLAEGAVLKAYFWNNRQQEFWIDDFSLTLHP